MPYTTETFTVLLTEPMWQLLDETAKKKGYDNDRRYVREVVRRIAAGCQTLPSCKKKGKKRQTRYPVPPYMEASLEKLSCKVGSPLSTIITMFLLVDMLDQDK